MIIIGTTEQRDFQTTSVEVWYVYKLVWGGGRFPIIGMVYLTKYDKKSPKLNKMKS